MVRVGASSENYLENRLLSAYFDAREHEAYFRSLKLAETRRDSHETIIPVLMNFVGEVLSAPTTVALDAILAASPSTSAPDEETGDPTEEARRLHPSGFELLGIGDRLDFETLKSSYRRAALRSHPDKGGSHQQMVLVNEAYSLFHELLCQRQLASGGGNGMDGTFGIGFDVPIRTAKDYLYVIGLLLLDIKVDEWGLDDAHYWATTLASDEWACSAYAQHPRTQANLLFPCSTLAGRLWAAGLRDQAQEVYQIAEGSLRVAEANDLFLGGGLSEATFYMKEGRKLRFVLNHRRQADNALRLGLIDGKRYKQTIERLGGKKEQSDGHAEALRAFIAEGGFLPDLPTDRVTTGKTVRSKLVPEPGYFVERIEYLTDDQQAEYLRAFSASTDLSLVTKYAHIRIASLLRSMILHDVQSDLAAIERECRKLTVTLPQSLRFYFGEVAQLAQFLAGLDPSDRLARCDILRELDNRATDGVTISYNLASGEAEQSDSTFRVRLNPDYLATVRLPLERLRLALQTGSTKTKEEQTKERETWNRDIGVINSPRVQESQRAVFEASTKKDNLEPYIQTVKFHCELLLELGRSMVHVEQLQVGYYLDRLTIALTRLKRWDEARRWLDLYFAVPERYRGRSSRGEVEAMTKRLERCVREISR
jgi:hypothetical protein